jgi:hypothetical protein
MPTEPIPYAVTRRGQGEYLPTQGAFRKGEDDRRHIFTREECQKGYRNAVESLLRRFPGCDPHFLHVRHHQRAALAQTIYFCPSPIESKIFLYCNKEQSHICGQKEAESPLEVSEWSILYSDSSRS